MVTLTWTFNLNDDFSTIFNWIKWVPYFIFNWRINRRGGGALWANSGGQAQNREVNLKDKIMKYIKIESFLANGDSCRPKIKKNKFFQ